MDIVGTIVLCLVATLAIVYCLGPILYDLLPKEDL